MDRASNLFLRLGQLPAEKNRAERHNRDGCRQWHRGDFGRRRTGGQRAISERCRRDGGNTMGDIFVTDGRTVRKVAVTVSLQQSPVTGP